MSPPPSNISPAVYRRLYVQVVTAIVAGVLLGVSAPEFAAQLQPLGDAFIRAIMALILALWVLSQESQASQTNIKDPITNQSPSRNLDLSKIIMGIIRSTPRPNLSRPVRSQDGG